MDFVFLTNALLALFAVTWVGSALWAGRTEGQSSWRTQGPLYAAGAVFCIALALLAWAIPAMWQRLWSPHLVFDAAMMVMQLAAIAWCWWARIHIGRLWSGGVVVKEGHHVVDTGPYGIVRHPIYTGAFVLVLAHLLVKARAVDLLFYAGFVVFFVVKARVEEGFLAEQLGEAYARYRQRVPMLLPAGRARRLSEPDRTPPAA